MNNFIWLVFGHYIGDVALQSDWQSNNKGKYWYIMWCHCVIWATCVCVAMRYAGVEVTNDKIIFLITGHFLADTLKTRFPKDKEHFWMIYPDQLWHLLQLVIVYIA